MNSTTKSLAIGGNTMKKILYVILLVLIAGTAWTDVPDENDLSGTTWLVNQVVVFSSDGELVLVQTITIPKSPDLGIDQKVTWSFGDDGYVTETNHDQDIRTILPYSVKGRLLTVGENDFFIYEYTGDTMLYGKGSTVWAYNVSSVDDVVGMIKQESE